MRSTTTIIVLEKGAREAEDRSGGGGSRRPSFRVGKPVLPYEMTGDDEKMINLDTSASEASVAHATTHSSSDEDRRMTRRRASQL